jgi:ABC-type thiamine transport system ATPase subunit
MKENDKPNVHFAVYLTHGIYLSLFGSTGSIIASTLQEMKKGFSTPHAAKLTLQDESSQSLGTLRVKDLK